MHQIDTLRQQLLGDRRRRPYTGAQAIGRSECTRNVQISGADRHQVVIHRAGNTGRIGRCVGSREIACSRFHQPRLHRVRSQRRVIGDHQRRGTRHQGGRHAGPAHVGVVQRVAIAAGFAVGRKGNRGEKSALGKRRSRCDQGGYAVARRHQIRLHDMVETRRAHRAVRCQHIVRTKVSVHVT